jgi:hypothetical protein
MIAERVRRGAWRAENQVLDAESDTNISQREE